MIWGAVAQMVTLILVVAGFNIGGKSGGILVTTMFFLFYDAFAVSYLNIPWLYALEINNLQMRAQGSALACASNGLCKYQRPINCSFVLTDPSQWCCGDD